ncbi:MAG TPA: 16S rRNA (guanine(966)-N(2))-methyltransferase RsmD [bacterium]|nr:16S rRNA (guanine(966)-N(2))-methyltransferase RsmD [bacterium]
MLRIIGGRLRGRRFNAPPGRQTRPTADKVREAIFNTLASLMDLDGVEALDLFAGSGALGLEALSRGAAHCTFVEAHGRTAAGIRANLGLLGLEPATAQVVTARVESWLRQAALPRPADLVLADPPYAYGEHDALLAGLADSGAVAPGALIVLEMAEGQALAAHPRLEVLRMKGYGDTQVCFLEKQEPTVPPSPAEPPH